MQCNKTYHSRLESTQKYASVHHLVIVARCDLC